MRRELTGKIAIITGASSGIGEAAAREFARAGAVVVVTARRVERLERLAEEIRREGGQALPIPADLTVRDQITGLVQTTLNTYGRIDILANIAGWGRYDWLEEMQPEDLSMQYEVNVIGMAELIRQVLPAMKRQRAGHIINMSSYASKVATPPLTIYASTKYAVEGLSDGLRRELRPWGILVSRVHPSGVSGTEFNEKAAQAGGIRFKSLPIGRVTRERVARELVKLARRPRRAVFLSRWYDIPAFINYRAPRLVDVFSGLWVRYKRPELDLFPPPVRQAARLALPAALLSLAGVLAARIVKRRG